MSIPPLKSRKTKSLLTFSGGIEMEHWGKISGLRVDVKSNFNKKCTDFQREIIILEYYFFSL